MPRIFISYRRADSKATAGRIRDRLAEAFGRDNIFLDVEDIPAGADFRTFLQNKISQADIVLIIIGPKWASILRRRRNDANDFVRIELESALEQRKITIPVRVEGASIPSPDDVPKRVQTVFPFLNAITIGDDPIFHRDVDRLIAELQNPEELERPSPLPLLAEKPSRKPINRLIISAGLIATVAIFFIGLLVLQPNNLQSDGTQVGLVSSETQTASPTPTNEPSLTPTPQPTDTLPPTVEPSLTPTLEPSSTPTLTSEPTLALTMTSEPTDTAINTSVPIAVLSNTPESSRDPIATVQVPPIAFVSASQNINLRSGPGTDSGIIAALPPGEQIMVLDEDGSGRWIKIRRFNGSEGWLFHDLIIVIGTPTPIPSPTPSPTFDPTLAHAGQMEVSSNSQWRPIIRQIGEVEMVYVPKGCFVMGSETGEDAAQPISRQCILQPFWLDRTEVTNEQFANVGGFAASPVYFSGDKRPREGVTWFEARNFCTQRGGRLPTEVEWEFAARGPDNLEFPWGNYVSPVPAIFNTDQTEEVGLFPDGASWVGAFDMSGNVEEWVNSLFLPYPYNLSDGREDGNVIDFPRVVRGGSWSHYNFDWNNPQLRTHFRRSYSPDSYSVGTGFRCAHDHTG